MINLNQFRLAFSELCALNNSLLSKVISAELSLTYKTYLNATTKLTLEKLERLSIKLCNTSLSFSRDILKGKTQILN